MLSKDKDPYDKRPRLVPHFDRMGRQHLSDELLAIAYNIETVFLEMGAEPGHDYDYINLMELAQPFVLHMFSNDKEPSLNYNYPADNVAPPIPSADSL